MTNMSEEDIIKLYIMFLNIGYDIKEMTKILNG
jgi:hypothetical protein